MSNAERKQNISNSTKFNPNISSTLKTNNNMVLNPTNKSPLSLSINFNNKDKSSSRRIVEDMSNNNIFHQNSTNNTAVSSNQHPHHKSLGSNSNNAFCLSHGSTFGDKSVIYSSDLLNNVLNKDLESYHTFMNHLDFYDGKHIIDIQKISFYHMMSNSIVEEICNENSGVSHNHIYKNTGLENFSSDKIVHISQMNHENTEGTQITNENEGFFNEGKLTKDSHSKYISLSNALSESIKKKKSNKQYFNKKKEENTPDSKAAKNKESKEKETSSSLMGREASSFNSTADIFQALHTQNQIKSSFHKPQMQLMDSKMTSKPQMKMKTTKSNSNITSSKHNTAETINTVSNNQKLSISTLVKKGKVSSLSNPNESLNFTKSQLQKSLLLEKNSLLKHEAPTNIKSSIASSCTSQGKQKKSNCFSRASDLAEKGKRINITNMKINKLHTEGLQLKVKADKPELKKASISPQK